MANLESMSMKELIELEKKIREEKQKRELYSKANVPLFSYFYKAFGGSDDGDGFEISDRRAAYKAREIEAAIYTICDYTLDNYRIDPGRTKKGVGIVRHGAYVYNVDFNVYKDLAEKIRDLSLNQISIRKNSNEKEIHN